MPVKRNTTPMPIGMRLPAGFPMSPPSKIMPVSTNRNIAQQHAPQQALGDLQRSATSTYFTRAGATDVLYNADRTWVQITLTLETAGPVAVGFAALLTPVLSGKGILLQTGTPHTFTIAKGSKLYIASTSLNRVNQTLQPFPWLEQIVARQG